MTEAVPAMNPPWVQDVTGDAVRHFAWGVGDNNPLWLDPEYGQRSRWQARLAPPCFLYAVHETTVAPGFEDRQRIYRSVDWQWFDVIRLGTQVRSTAQLIDTRTESDGTMQTGQVEFFDLHDTRLASATTSCWRPLKSRRVSEQDSARYTEDQLAAIEQAVLAESRRGEQTRIWEDTEVGEQLATLTKGPLSIMDIVAWCAGALGVPAPEDAVSTGGLVDEAATAPQQTAWLAHLVTDWAGDDAFLAALNVAISRLATLGSTTFLNGEVTRRSAHVGQYVVHLSLTATNTEDELLATATAIVLLPSKQHGPVSLPVISLNQPDQ